MVLDITLKSYFDVHSSAWHHSQEALNKPKLLQNEASVKKKKLIDIASWVIDLVNLRNLM